MLGNKQPNDVSKHRWKTAAAVLSGRLSPACARIRTLIFYCPWSCSKVITYMVTESNTHLLKREDGLQEFNSEYCSACVGHSVINLRAVWNVCWVALMIAEDIPQQFHTDLQLLLLKHTHREKKVDKSKNGTQTHAHALIFCARSQTHQRTASGYKPTEKFVSGVRNWM